MILFAHGIVGRADLPIPETLFAAAAAAVLVVSFAALAAGWSQPKLARLRERALFPLPLAVEVVFGALGIFFFGLTVYAGIAGTGAQSENLAPTAVYVAFWVGVPFASLIFGDVWRLISPWRALGRATGWLASRFSSELPEPLPYPERVGRWPAAAVIFGFAICELCWAKATEPGPLAIIMLVYLIAMLVGMSIYGVEPWVRNADGFGVLWSLIASLAPIGRREDGRLFLRIPGTGAAKLPPAVAIVAIIWTLGMLGTCSLANGRRFAHTLIPIASGYLVAHYFSLLAYNGQDLWRLINDPLGKGSDLFGGGESGIDYGIITATGIWYVQVAALVIGHVWALVLAHDRALEIYRDPRAATRSQIAMLILMVAFTCLGLWLLSAALNT